MQGEDVVCSKTKVRSGQVSDVVGWRYGGMWLGVARALQALGHQWAITQRVERAGGVTSVRPLNPGHAKPKLALACRYPS